MDSTYTRYQLRCRQRNCYQFVRISAVACTKCGLASANFFTPAPSSNQILKRCESCGALTNADKAPDHCHACKEENLSWWDHQAQMWHHPALETALKEETGIGYWISGDFVGDAEGPLLPNLIENRTYRLQLHSGVLKGTQRVDGPPKLLEKDEPSPLRQELVPNVSVEFGEASNPQVAPNTRLNDFRLHRWTQQTLRETRGSLISSGQQALGRVSGIAYAFVKLPPLAAPPPPPVEKSIDPHLSSEAPPKSDTSGDLPSTPTPSDSRRERCAVCNPGLIGGFALFIWWTCGWKTSLIGVVAVASIYCVINRWLSSAEGDKHRIFNRWGMLIPVLLMLAGILLGLVAGERGFAQCDHPFWDLSAWLAIAGFMTTLLVRRCWFKTLLSVGWIYVLVSHCLFGVLYCAPQHQVPTLAPSSAQPSSDPRPDSTNVQLPNLTEIGQALENELGKFNEWLNESFHFDPTTEAVTQASIAVDDGSRISVDDAVAQPELLEQCTRSIYFPNASMFALNSAQINPSMESQLQKLQNVLNAYPDRRFVVTGHTDQLGNDTDEGIFQNVLLSEARAQAVAEWLSAELGVSSERIIAAGSGSNFPIINIEGAVPINRRVEIRLDCLHR